MLGRPVGGGWVGLVLVVVLGGELCKAAHQCMRTGAACTGRAGAGHELPH